MPGKSGFVLSGLVAMAAAVSEGAATPVRLEVTPFAAFVPSSPVWSPGAFMVHFESDTPSVH